MVPIFLELTCCLDPKENNWRSKLFCQLLFINWRLLVSIEEKCVCVQTVLLIWLNACWLISLFLLCTLKENRRGCGAYHFVCSQYRGPQRYFWHQDNQPEFSKYCQRQLKCPLSHHWWFWNHLSVHHWSSHRDLEGSRWSVQVSYRMTGTGEGSC